MLDVFGLNVFETTADPAEASEGAPAEGAAAEPEAAQTGAAEGAAEAAPETPSAAWAPSQDEWQQTQQTLRQLTELLTAEPNSPAATEQDTRGFFERYFPLDEEGQFQITEDGLQKAIRAEATGLFEEQFGTYQPILDSVASDRGAQQMEAEFSRLEETIGGFDHELASVVAGALSNAGVANPQEAITEAARYVHAKIEEAGKAAVEAYKTAEAERLQVVERAANAPVPPSGDGAATEGMKPASGLRGYEDVANAFLERRTLA